MRQRKYEKAGQPKKVGGVRFTFLLNQETTNILNTTELKKTDLVEKAVIHYNGCETKSGEY